MAGSEVVNPAKVTAPSTAPQAAQTSSRPSHAAGVNGSSEGPSNWLETCPSSHRLTSFWLNFMFFCARHAQWFMRHSEWMWMGLSKLAFRRALRAGPGANAKWLLGPDATAAEQRRLVDGVIRHFYRFIYDVGRSSALTRRQILDRIESVRGKAHYDAARAEHRGIIFATAHLGSFEVGLAAIADMEPGVHVVFQHDVFEAFEAIRQEVHRKVGVTDAPVDQGLDVWMKLREVLESDGVVLMQADRVMPGHRGMAVPFMGGHIRMPLGPIKLAAMSGAPILPVFVLRQPDGRTRLIIEPAIDVSPEQGRPGKRDPPEPLRRLAQTIQPHVRAYPEQWLMLSPMWCEDQGEQTAGGGG